MPVVVADTGPINYLVLIEAIELLQHLFGRVNISTTVYKELTHARTPEAVRMWMARGAPWLEVKKNPDREADSTVSSILNDGERTTIELAAVIRADLILMDDRDAVAFARAQGFAVTGTLGVLDLAARRGLIDLVQAFSRLKGTTFHYRRGLLDALLAEHVAREK